MIEFHLRLTIRNSKGPEIRQALESLGRSIRARTGCQRCTFYVRERDSRGMMVQIWDDRTTLNAYLRSKEHQVLLGAISTLCLGCTIHFRGTLAGPGT